MIMKSSLKILLILVVMSLISYNSDSKTNKETIKNNQKIDNFSDKYIYVRLKSSININNTIKKIQDFVGAGEYYQLIKPEESIKSSLSTLTNTNIIENSDRYNKIVVAEEPLLRTFRIKLNSLSDIKETTRNLLNQFPEIDLIEQIIPNKQLTQYIPNDPMINKQSLLAKVKAFDAWSVCKGDTNIIIAISDNGILQNHEDLKGNIAPNWKEIPNDGIDNDSNGYVDDFLGYNFTYKTDGRNADDTENQSDEHGTAVASLAGATVNNAIGMAGTGFKCRIFPIKVAKYGSKDYIYSYESILYAAKRNFKIINCSWGLPKPPSIVDQDIIDYAVSKDLAIVAAAGNGEHSIIPTYPAAYNNVLSVGNTTLGDEISYTTTLGAEVDLFAPGEGSLIATNEIKGYKIEPGGGTSYASPVVAGALGIVRSKYPNLTAVQSIEFLRQCTDDISMYNDVEFQKILPGRLNMKKAVEIEPLSIPSIRPVKLNLFSKDWTQIERFLGGDTAYLQISAFNYLGSAKNLKFVLSVGYDPTNSLNIIDSITYISEVTPNQNLNINTFTLNAKNRSNSRIILRVDIYGENDYHDFFMSPIYLSPEYTNFSNNIISFSVGDAGQIGYVRENESDQGLGFSFSNYGNQLFKSGLMVVAENSKVVTANFGYGRFFSDFRNIKPFTNPNKYIGIVDDSSRTGPFFIGVDVTQIYNIPGNNNSVVTIDVTAKNNTAASINDLSVGYYFDWDIYPNADSNKVELFPEAIPESFKQTASGAEVAYYSGSSKAPYCGCAVFSNNDTYKPQLAGLDYSITKNFSTNSQIASLTSNSSIQYNNIGDVQIIAGMKFPGVLKSNETRTFKFHFGCAGTKDSLAEALKSAMLGLSVSNPQHLENINMFITPIPALDRINIQINGNLKEQFEIDCFDITGNHIFKLNDMAVNGNQFTINKDISQLTPGIYYLKLVNGSQIVIKQFIKL